MTRILKTWGTGLLLLISCLSNNQLFAQGKQITGTVKSSEGNQPLPGVTVAVKGTKNSVATDANGQYRITVDDKATTLVFSSASFASREVPIPVNGLAAVDVTLSPQVTTGDDVVVVGYTSIKKKDLTGATSSMAGKDIEKVPVSSVAEALTGRLAGVQVTTLDGAPGEIIIRIRGGGSVTQDNSPLYIVDGFPVSSINDIATTDIVNIDILKDASSAAIYGARGANGVVIITTKSAKGGKTVVSFNSYLQGRTLPKKLKVYWHNMNMPG